ncbi:MAG: hypothetical protein ACLRMZ_27795 [Blautia marasmi]
MEERSGKPMSCSGIRFFMLESRLNWRGDGKSFFESEHQLGTKPKEIDVLK